MYAMKRSTTKLSIPSIRLPMTAFPTSGLGVPHGFPGGGAIKADCRKIATKVGNVKAPAVYICHLTFRIWPNIR